MQNGQSKYTFGDIRRKLSPAYVEVTPTEKVAAKLLLSEAIPEAFDHRRGANLTVIAMMAAEGATTEPDTIGRVAERLKAAIDDVVVRVQGEL